MIRKKKRRNVRGKNKQENGRRVKGNRKEQTQ
jgi:hypothetical protein